MKLGMCAILMAILSSCPLLAADFDYEALEKLIKDKGVTSVEGLVGVLPEAFFKPGYFVLGYESRSSQEVTPANPRAIVFTADARTIIAFNGGDPKLTGSDTVEVIQWRDVDRKFEFHVIQFQGAGKIDYGTATPKTCIGCHNPRDPRPNWDSYPLWPGFYTNENQVYSPERELTGWAAFKKVQGENARYKRFAIPWRETDGGKVPFELDRGVSRLTFAVAKLNSRRIARLVRKIPGIERVRFAALAAAGGCDKIEDFFPLENASSNRSMLSKLEANLRVAYEAEHKQKTLRHLGNERPGDSIFKRGVQDEANLPFLARMSAVLAMVGRDTSDWSTAFSEKTASYSNGVGTTFWFRPRLYSDPTFAAHYEGLFQSMLEAFGLTSDDAYLITGRKLTMNQGTQMTVVDVRPDCDGLKKKNLAAFGKR